MDGSQFDKLIRSLAGSRRAMLSGTLALAAGWRGASRVESKKKRKHRNKATKPKPNAFGCLEVGDSCKNADQCCSGVCEGKKGKKRCLAHDTGTCRQDGLGICTADSATPFACNNSEECVCFHTTAGSNFCADLASFGQEFCADCQQDADCQALGFPRGSACIPFSDGACAGKCENGMACLAPCGTPRSEDEPPSPMTASSPTIQLKESPHG